MVSQVQEDSGQASSKSGHLVERNLRQDSEMWIATAWHKVYNFPICKEGMTTQGEKFVEGKFIHPPHPKDGYPLPDCKDPRARKMLEFLISILYLEKPTKINITVGNTIFGAYTCECMVEWALVVRDTIKRLVTRIGKSKPTPICPYLLHLYYIHYTIQPEDKKVYMVRESFMRDIVKLDEKKQPAGTEELDYESHSLERIAKLQA